LNGIRGQTNTIAEVQYAKGRPTPINGLRLHSSSCRNSDQYDQIIEDSPLNGSEYRVGIIIIIEPASHMPGLVPTIEVDYISLVKQDIIAPTLHREDVGTLLIIVNLNRYVFRSHP